MAGLLIQEWIEQSGGAERVLDAMAHTFPNADLLCLWNDAPGRFPGHAVHESWLARTPLRGRKALALPLMPATWRTLRTGRAYDWMLISSYVFAHHARLPRRDVPKFIYAHTPARYIWAPELDERGDHPAVRAAAPLFRRLDRARAKEPVAIAANSRFVRDRVRHAWDRDATVIHPPVAVDRLLAQGDWSAAVTDDAEQRVRDALPDTFVLGVSRFTPYKRLDLVIQAGERTGLPVVIAGSGPDESRLRALAAGAAVPVTFVIFPSDALLYTLMQRAAVFVFPAIEDFGIVPVEAQAVGTPVVTGPLGGQLETFTAGVSGVVASSTDPGDLASAITAAIALPAFDAAAATAGFSEAIFAEKIRAFVGDA
ncbi:glycosyltransferase [Microbacterium sp. Mu-80]|uniref:D-inositol 3-phosphate glycosyltransferase n=1 Tax=Microbacterium bandirmense TaxID=3122050 RepID=A0ABU8LAA5_9MICO